MGRIRMKQVEGFGKVSLESAIDQFLRSCRLRNLSPKTIRYYEEDLEYFSRNICVKYYKMHPEMADKRKCAAYNDIDPNETK